MKLDRSISAVFLATAFAVLAGCASLPSPEVMKSETASFQLPKLPESGKAIVYVVRPSGMGGLVRFNVFVDDQEAASEMGYTRSSQYIYFNVKPGTHKIYSKAENWADTEISAKDGDIIYIQQEPSMGVIMARNSVSKIDEVQGKYQVKQLQLGTVLKAEK
ncbi:MAG TPA: DUF2846 domain-containing protein [Variovorax sp.]|nr:DUF2846 domain-containing protein [Variovorax sp.]